MMRITCIALFVLASGCAHASGQACDINKIVPQAWPDTASVIGIRNVVDNHRLRPVLSGLVVNDNSAEWDGNCAGNATEISRTLSLAETTSNGYNDIILTEKRTDSVSRGNAPNC